MSWNVLVLQAQDLTDGLRVYWPFDGNLSEKLGDYHAANRGGVSASFLPGRFGEALFCDGDRSVVEVGARNDRALDTYHVSLSLWVKIEEGGTLLDKGSCSWSLSYEASSGTLEFGAYWGVDFLMVTRRTLGLGLMMGNGITLSASGMALIPFMSMVKLLRSTVMAWSQFKAAGFPLPSVGIPIGVENMAHSLVRLTNSWSGNAR
ncbi:MAG: hypothetical protein ACI957_003149 [Verrucomicrobiales bacterium]|jgi:hypothetical protein